MGARKSVRWPVSRVLYHLRGGDHSSGMGVTAHLTRPTRTAMRKTSRAVPIWSCSRWGLPCRLCCQRRGALLPHHFNLAAAFRAGRRCHFCGAIPGVAPAGRYPAPSFRGARTFLEHCCPRSPGHLTPAYTPGAVQQCERQQPRASSPSPVPQSPIKLLRAEMALEGGHHFLLARTEVIAKTAQRLRLADWRSRGIAAKDRCRHAPTLPGKDVRRDPPCAPEPRRCGPARGRKESGGATECLGTA